MVISLQAWYCKCDWVKKWNSYGLMYRLHVMIITCFTWKYKGWILTLSYATMQVALTHNIVHVHTFILMWCELLCMLYPNVFILVCMCSKLLVKCICRHAANCMQNKWSVFCLQEGRTFCSSRASPQLAVSRRGHVRKSLTFQFKYANDHESVKVFFVIFISPW
jgi:hypothetical protein